jgi:bifunctional non-homologous end joining protein LigD
MKKNQINVGPQRLEITHPEKVLFPEDDITKGEFVEYYHRVAGLMIPHIRDRPIIMHRFPEGIQGEGFYHQAIPESVPAWVPRVTVKKEGGTVTHILCQDAAALVYIANLGCITPHVWLSRKDELEKPDQMIFDLDPPGNDFEPVRQGARLLKSLLDEIGLASFLKTTGSRGLHVVVPLRVAEGFDLVRDFALGIAKIMTRREPQKYTTEQRKEKRRDRLFIDTLRNAYAHTAVAPYAVRALKGAPVAAPLFWQELDDPEMGAQRFHIRNIFQRLEKDGDPWKNMERRARSLEQYRRRWRELRDLSGD